jgi:hypothetical protein
LTGDGLIQALSSPIYSKSFLNIDNPEFEAENVLKELEDELEPGLILSFSTPSHGHTGIISRYGNKWTFLNSGLMDNPVGKKVPAKRAVGEEDLKAEIENWFRQASDEKKSLKISIGRLDNKKLLTFLKEPKIYKRA